MLILRDWASNKDETLDAAAFVFLLVLAPTWLLWTWESSLSTFMTGAALPRALLPWVDAAAEA